VTATPRIVGDDAGLRELAAEARHAPRLAVDLEASGMFAYRARVCTMQLARDGGRSIVVVDALAAPIAPLAPLLGDHGPTKIVHDVAFDARLLAESHIALGNVHDTSVAARMLGRAATGLASLLKSELGLCIGKTLQRHDWRVRPLDPGVLTYLAEDVAHLEALESRLWTEVVERGIEDAVLEETSYRIASAIAAVNAPASPPPYVRVKGASALAERDLAALRVVAWLREREAQLRDVPPHKVAPNEALIAIARARPASSAQLARVRGISTSSPAARAFVAEMASAIATAGDRLPDEERVYFEAPRVPAAVARARRKREALVIAWRRAEAKLRGVDEQVVLPGHCVKDAVDADVTDVEALSRIPGIGAFRLRRDGDAIVGVLRGDGARE
jgi:ribonuclease D